MESSEKKLKSLLLDKETEYEYEKTVAEMKRLLNAEKRKVREVQETSV